MSEFEAYGIECLRSRHLTVQEALSRRQIDSSKIPPLERAYGIVVTLEEGLKVDRLRLRLQQQIEAIAQFLAMFHIDVLGQPTRLMPLYEVELVVAKRRKLKLSLDRGRLTLAISPQQLRSRSGEAKYLKQAWHRGELLKDYYPRSLQKLWWLFDPIGIFRFNLRSLLVLAVQKQILGIDRILLKITAPEGETEGDKSSLKARAIAFLQQNVRQDKLGYDLNLVLQKYSDRALIHILHQYKDNLRDPQQIEEILDAGSLLLQDTLTQEQSGIDIKMLGFVNVGNYHRIDVAIHCNFGYLQRYVEVIPRHTEVKARQIGFVNVYTIDDITVTPNLHQALDLHWTTAALAKTLQTFNPESQVPLSPQSNSAQ
ncbi:MAG: hypothetical protein SAJ12_16130 [Jaaginema sp. PMC 1079.18]|nr:hypothetical protein [Jaaginema sp. PMC 1080.18]MEC4852513.1 hypothetical protein [Jaaginema sp. PMC 1079.18]